MTTKEQERKALAKIREIVDGLGEYSYIGSAMEGIWEIAEDNIDNDFGTSHKDMIALRDKEINTLKETCANLRGENKALHDNAKTLQDEIDKQSISIANMEDLLEKNNERFKEYEDKIMDMEARHSAHLLDASYLEDEIIRLKARLFDMYEKDGRI